jgi:hypothetical protein
MKYYITEFIFAASIYKFHSLAQINEGINQIFVILIYCEQYDRLFCV